MLTQTNQKKKESLPWAQFLRLPLTFVEQNKKRFPFAFAEQNKKENLPWMRFKTLREVSIRWSDIDCFNHVTNSVYLNYIENTRLKLYENLELLRIAFRSMNSDYRLVVVDTNIQYRKQALRGDRLIVGARVCGIRKVFIDCECEIYNQDTRELIAKSSSTEAFIDRKKLKAASIPKEVISELLQYS